MPLASDVFRAAGQDAVGMTGGGMFERIHSEPGLVRLHLRGGLDGEASRAMREGLAECALIG